MPLHTFPVARSFTAYAIAGFVALASARAVAQAPAASGSAAGGTASSEEEPVNVGDSPVGYIDGAIPGNQFRLRFDAAYHNERPTRAEFFYARGAPLGPGLPKKETSVDYQDITAYLEVALGRCTSVFADLPIRFLNPDINNNTAGLADVNVGFKRALIYGDDCVASFQLKVYIPAGDADRGLGNNHATIEPGLLLFKRLSDCLTLESELRYWVPVDGTEGFEGEVLRYGVGLGYNWFKTCNV